MTKPVFIDALAHHVVDGGIDRTETLCATGVNLFNKTSQSLVNLLCIAACHHQQ